MKVQKLNESCESPKRTLPEDFDMNNLNKRGTVEYESNANRLKRINMYRDYANLGPDEVITEDTINDWALTKTSTMSNRSVDRIKSELLGIPYTGYELDDYELEKK